MVKRFKKQTKTKKILDSILTIVLDIGMVGATIIVATIIIVRLNIMAEETSNELEKVSSSNTKVNVDNNNPRIEEPINAKQQKLYDMLQVVWNKPKTQEIVNKLSENGSVRISFEADLKNIREDLEWGNFKGITSGKWIVLNENINFTNSMLYKIFYHELFHAFHNSVEVTFEDFEDNKVYVSTYAKTSVGEDLCETFADYMLRTYHNVNYYDKPINQYKAIYVKEKIKLYLGIDI